MTPDPHLPLKPQTVRDTRIDVFRALALLSIFVNHVPGTIYENATHKNFGFSDSAEAFVLISGIAIGLAYGGKFIPGVRLLMSLKALRRAGVLYVTQIMTALTTIAIFVLGATWLANPSLLAEINIEPMIDDPARALLGLVTMGHQLGYNNILSMYAAVMLLLPALLWLSTISLGLMVAVSGTLWLLAGIYQVAPPNYPTPGMWFLNPLSWQFLFAIGLAGMLHVRRGGKIVAHPLLMTAAAAYLVLAFAWVRVPLWGVDTSLGLPAVLTGFDKTFLSLPRLLHVLSLAYLLVAIPGLSELARLKETNPLASLGRHSLPVFIAGTLLAMVAQVIKMSRPESLLLDTLLISTGIALQFALAFYLDWYKGLQKSSKQAASHVKPRPTAVREDSKLVPARVPAERR
ncbi:membrane protein [Tianweitania populi]|uniref:Membrane protein n=1 Tax=Tianweitania populi TaxID=1607949 RepID=A0A8J3DXX9_9HYPH|nr:membrane protein [Tianweitania populi]